MDKIWLDVVEISDDGGTIYSFSFSSKDHFSFLVLYSEFKDVQEKIDIILKAFNE